MFEGIIHIRRLDAETGRLIDQRVVKNSITAQGLLSAMDGQLFPGTGSPLIHVYSHPDNVTPAVFTLSGYLDTCVETAAPSASYDAPQQYCMMSISGRLDPTGVARTITTIGLSRAGYADTPSFAVRLSNPVGQSPAQIIEVTYNIVARRSNNTSAAGSGTVVTKVSNNAWDTWFRAIYATTAGEPLGMIRLGTTPDSFSTGSVVGTGRNSMMENLGVAGGNTRSLSDVGVVSTPTVVQHLDETTMSVELEVENEEGIGFNFNKTLMHTLTGTQMYANDVGYDNAVPVYTAQNNYLHHNASTRPYTNLHDPFASGAGTLDIDVSTLSVANKFPLFVKATLMSTGTVDDATYYLSLRHTQGFRDNLYAAEYNYRLPAYPRRNESTGAWLRTLGTNNAVAYTGTTIASFNTDLMAAFSVRLSSVAGSTYIGDNNQSDAVCSPAPNALSFITNLGTTITQINSTTSPSFTATSMSNAAVVRQSGLSRVFLGCRATGLWRINEVLQGEYFSPGVPFQVAVPYVDTTQCFGVSSRNLSGDNTIFALFEGGLVRSMNGGSGWQVYNESGVAGTLPFSHTGLTDGNWSEVVAIIPGPTDTGTGQSVVALVLNDETVLWVELTSTTATVTGVTSIPGINQGNFLTQKMCAYFPAAAGVPSSQAWMFFDGTQVRRVAYTLGAGPGAITNAPANLSDPVKVRFFEPTDKSPTAPLGMVMYDNVTQSVVLVNSAFSTITDFESLQAVNSTLVAGLLNASCKPYRHFYMTSVPQFAYFNPFANALPDGGAAHHLVWHDYQWLGGEWIRLVGDDIPTGQAITWEGRPCHGTMETVFSSSPNGILSDMSPGVSLMFETNDAATPFVADEYFTFTLTSGIQKDEYTAFTHRVSHNFYRSEFVSGLATVPALAADLAGRALNFCTGSVENTWFSQQGVLSSINTNVATLTRSELTTPASDQSYAVSFRVTAPESTGTFAIGIGRDNMDTALGGGNTLATVLPIRIEFTGDEYRVYRESTAATSIFTITQGAKFTISVNGSAGTFQISVNDVPLALTTASTIPTSLVGNLQAIGAYALDNENRYAYDMQVVSWPVASSGGQMAYYKLLAAGTDIISDGQLVTVESKMTNPTSLVLNGVDDNVLYVNNPRTVLGLSGAVDQVKLLPKTALLLVNSTPSISSATVDALLYKK